MVSENTRVLVLRFEVVELVAFILVVTGYADESFELYSICLDG